MFCAAPRVSQSWQALENRVAIPTPDWRCPPCPFNRRTPLFVTSAGFVPPPPVTNSSGVPVPPPPRGKAPSPSRRGSSLDESETRRARTRGVRQKEWVGRGGIIKRAYRVRSLLLRLLLYFCSASTTLRRSRSFPLSALYSSLSFALLGFIPPITPHQQPSSMEM